MSKETAPQSKEQQSPKLETLNHQEQLERIRERLEHGQEYEPGANKEKSIEAARSNVEKSASPKDELLKSLNQEGNSQQESFEPFDRKLSFKKTMSDVQRQLSRPRRTFSKIIHHPTVDKASEVAGKTVGRPSLLLGGFGATFIGSLTIYLIASRNGYHLASLSFIVLLFALGACLGLFGEFIYRLLRSHR